MTPCGVKLYRYNDIEKYLITTDSKLRIDSFNLSGNVEISPKYYTEKMKENVSLLELYNGFAILSLKFFKFNSAKKLLFQDISRGKEKIPIFVRGQPISLDFGYITGYNFDYIDIDEEDNLGRTGCQCIDNCRDKIKCSCWRLTVREHLH